MIRERLFCIFVLLSVLLTANADSRQHVVKPGDTLYSLSKRYGVTVEDIQAANPSIEGTNIPAGMTLVIPDENEVSKKKDKKRSIFFNFKKRDKNKDKVAEEMVEQPVAENKVEEEKPKPDPRLRQKKPGAPDNIAVILPFNLEAHTSTDDKLQMRSVEFYEGLLMAVNEAQQNGQRVLIQTYDLGTKSIEEILATKSLLDADFIVAPMDAKDVLRVAEFGKNNNVAVVSPFAFNLELSALNPNLIQLNTSKSQLYDYVSDDVVKRFDDYEFVFLNDQNFADKSDPYASHLKNALKEKNKTFHEFAYTNPETLVSVDSLLNIAGRNILYIPVANSRDVLRRMFPCLKCTTFETEADSANLGQTAILGYPEWVLYANDFMDYYYDMNVYLFSKFYINPFDEKVKTFYKNFRYWYAKEPMSLTPRYAMLGYDIGRYFLAAVKTYGMNFVPYIEGFAQETLQSMMNFKPEGEGLINRGLYLVHFTPSTQIEKHEIK